MDVPAEGFIDLTAMKLLYHSWINGSGGLYHHHHHHHQHYFLFSLAILCTAKCCHKVIILLRFRGVSPTTELNVFSSWNLVNLPTQHCASETLLVEITFSALFPPLFSPFLEICIRKSTEQSV